jgi:hypothetical protein
MMSSICSWAKFVGDDQATLFVGIDVTHPGPMDKDTPSIGAIVANIDADATKWAASIKVPRPRSC